MKNIIVLLLVAAGFITCKKSNSNACMPVSPNLEAPQIAAFCTSNNINYTIDSNGIYYQVLDAGSGVKPNESSVITVTYTAETLDENIIEDKSTTPVIASLNKFNEGLRIAIPYIQKGGHIKIVLPSSLAYGCTGVSGTVPPNSPLYYDLVLVDVQ